MPISSKMVFWFAVTCMAIGAAITGIVFWAIPLLWETVKPWLHMVTA